MDCIRIQGGVDFIFKKPVGYYQLIQSTNCLHHKVNLKIITKP